MQMKRFEYYLTFGVALLVILWWIYILNASTYADLQTLKEQKEKTITIIINEKSFNFYKQNDCLFPDSIYLGQDSITKDIKHSK
jgi:hypothetical protein